MIKQFYLEEWLRENRPTVLTRSGYPVTILYTHDIVVEARVNYSPDSAENITCYNNGICRKREKGDNTSELDLFMKIEKNITDFEQKLVEIMIPSPLSREDAVNRAIAVAPILKELLKKELGLKETADVK